MGVEVATRERRLREQVQQLTIADRPTQEGGAGRRDHRVGVFSQPAGAGARAVVAAVTPLRHDSKVRHRRGKRRSRAKVISIHSYRGGTGKSNLTANVAASLAAAGKRVAVVDTDIQSPGIHILFGLEERSDPDAERLPLGRCAIERDGHRRHAGVARRATGGGVRLIPSSLKAGEIARVLREGYDVGLLNDGFHA